MKIKFIIIFLIVFTFIPAHPVYSDMVETSDYSDELCYGFCSKNDDDKKDDYISIMYTRNFIANYGIYDLNSKEFKKVYSRENHDYSDFAIDHKSNTLYYSAAINKKYNLYKVDLSKKKLTPEKLLEDNINADVFRLNNNKIFFRTRMYGHRNFTIGVYDLSNKRVNIWNEDETDRTNYTFCCNKFNNKIYTIEYSIKDAHSINTTGMIPTNSIVKYDENGNKEKELYSTRKWIYHISVNSDGTKALIIASEDEPVFTLYLIDLNTGKEEILFKTKETFDGITFLRLKDPQFSSDDKGFYFFASTQNSKILKHYDYTDPLMSREIYYYNFSTKRITKIFGITDEVINRFKIN